VPKNPGSGLPQVLPWSRTARRGRIIKDSSAGEYRAKINLRPMLWLVEVGCDRSKLMKSEMSGERRPTHSEEARMMKIIAVRVSLLICTVAAPVTALAAPIAHLTLQSESGDFIGQGGNFDVLYQSPADTISAQIRRTLAGGSPAELLFVLDSPSIANDFGLLFFGTDQLNLPIQPGTYTSAQRADFAQPGHPGLDVSWQNRGSNTLTGSFTIRDVSFFLDSANVLQIATFDATFEQHSEGATPALFGRFQYAQSGTFPQVPEPVTLLLFAIGGGAAVHRRRSMRRER
jgi:hypothetical protein